MKKKTFRALKEAYYNELKKIGVIDTPKEEKPKKVVKKTTKKVEEGKEGVG